MNDNDTSKLSSPGLPPETAVHYDRFFGPFYFEPYAEEVARRIDPVNVSVALEIASGTGRVTRHIRERIPPQAKLIASDISDDMLAVAKKKLKQLDIDWQHIDAQQLPFDDNSIDLVVCCFGFMFVVDKQRAFAEVNRVLKPGSQFIFTTWDKLENNKASWTARSIAKQYLDKPLSASYDLPTSMHDEEDIMSLLRNAGFSRISVEKKRLFSFSPTAKAAAAGLLRGGIYDEIRKRDPDSMEELQSKVEKELAEKFGEAPLMAPMSALIGEMWK